MTDENPGRRADTDGTDEEPLGDDTDPDGLKAVLDGADEPRVNDGSGGHPRMTWSSVTEAGGTPPSTDDEPRTGFQFDLGGALARIAGGEPAAEPPAETPVADESSADSEPAAEEPPAAEPSVEEPPVADRSPAPEAESETPAPTADVAEATAVLGTAAATERMAPWESVVEPDEAPAAPLPTRSSTPVDADPTDYPRRTPGAHLEAQMRAEAPEPAPRPERSERDEPARPVPSASVFGDDATTTAAAAAAAAAAAGAPVLPAQGVPGAPSLPGAPSPQSGSLPTLPASNPAAPPPIVEPVQTQASTNDLNALRSTQLRQSKQQRQGKLIGRLLLAVVVLGGLIAAALLFGRSLLFTTEWDAELTPVVNEVEAARGAEFADTVPLQVLPAAEYGELLRAATIGDAWVDQVPHWRALGLANGTVTAESVGASLAASTVAFYDPTSDTIYRVESVDADAANADLRAALEQAFDRQVTGVRSAEAVPADQPTFTGVSTLDSIAARSVDHWLSSGGSVGERRPADQSLPLPIAYELAAVDSLGEAVLTAAGIDPASMSVGEALPESAAGVLDDDLGSTAAGLLLPGDTAIAPPRALGTDDWSLVWAARLPIETVDRLVSQVTADSYRPIERNGLRCFTAVFETADAAAGSSALVSMLAWASASPSTAQAVATQLSETRVQLEACDPGAEGGTAPNEGAADQLVTRQITRLSN